MKQVHSSLNRYAHMITRDTAGSKFENSNFKCGLSLFPNT